jgi:hypothetical protein
MVIPQNRGVASRFVSYDGFVACLDTVARNDSGATQAGEPLSMLSGLCHGGTVAPNVSTCVYLTPPLGNSYQMFH